MATSPSSPTAAISKRAGSIRVTGVQIGIVAVAGSSFFEVRPPEAYGICMASHGRDLLNWTINMLAKTHLTVAQGVVSSIAYLAGFFSGAVIFHSWIAPHLLRLLP